MDKDHRLHDSDLSSGSSDPRPSGSHEPLVPEACPDQKPGPYHASALGQLISQTAKMAPVLAQHTHEGGAPHILSQDVGGPDHQDVQLTAPMDPTTKVKAVTPILPSRHDPPESTQEALYLAAQDRYEARREFFRSEAPVRSRPFSPTRTGGKMSPPPGVPIMGSQMLSMLPSQGGIVSTSLIRAAGSISSIPTVMPDSIAVTTTTPSSSVSALTQPGVAVTTPPGIRAVSTPCSVAMASTTSVVTTATGKTPSAITVSTTRPTGPTTITKDMISRPIASPKLVRTMQLKPLSETMPDVTPISTKQGAVHPPATSGSLVYQGTKKQAVKPQQPKVPLISQQQHQQVETVQLNSQQQAALKVGSQEAQTPARAAEPALKAGAQQMQATALPKTPEPSRTTAKPAEKVKVEQGKVPRVNVQEPSRPAPQPQQLKVSDKHSDRARSPQHGLKCPSPQDGQLKTPATAKPKSPGQQNRSRSGKAPMVKQKAVVSEIEPYLALAKAASPPRTLQAPEPHSEPETTRKQADSTESRSELQKARSLDSERIKAVPTIKHDDAVHGQILKLSDSASEHELEIVPEQSTVAQNAPKKPQLKDPRKLPDVITLYGTSLKRSSSAPMPKRGVLRAEVSTPDVTETRLVVTSSDDDRWDRTNKSIGGTSSQSEKEADFKTPPTTPSTSRTDLAGRESDRLSTDDTSKMASESDGSNRSKTFSESEYTSADQHSETGERTPPVSDVEEGVIVIPKREMEEPESVVAQDAKVTDKIAAWQKHLTQKSNQSNRQAVLRERRGHGVWSSGDSISEQASMLTPITEEQKSERSDSKTEVSGGSGEETSDISVALRIFQMENKQDEDKFSLTRPESGFTTPRLKVHRPLGSPLRGAFTPTLEPIQPTSPLATDERQLLDKLSHVADIAMVRDAAAERRGRFMQKRTEDRRRTQPITLEEIRQADSLESVSSFRAEVLRKSSLNIFEQGKENVRDPLGRRKVKGQETFPQHLKHERLKERRKDINRYRTLPVTQTELNEIPETETLTILQKSSSVKTLRQKLEEMEKTDSMEEIPEKVEAAKPDTKLESTKDSQSQPLISVQSKLVDRLKEKSPVTTNASSVSKDDSGVSKQMATSTVETQHMSLESPKLGNQSLSGAQAKQLSSPVKTVAMTTATTTTTTTATAAITAKTISAQKLSRMDVADDELDQLVEINYREISSHRRKQRQALAEARKKEQAIQRQGQHKSANQKEEPFKQANQEGSLPQSTSQDAKRNVMSSSQPQGKRSSLTDSQSKDHTIKAVSTATTTVITPPKTSPSQPGKVTEKIELPKTSMQKESVVPKDVPKATSVVHQQISVSSAQKDSQRNSISPRQTLSAKTTGDKPKSPNMGQKFQEQPKIAAGTVQEQPKSMIKKTQQSKSSSVQKVHEQPTAALQKVQDQPKTTVQKIQEQAKSTMQKVQQRLKATSQKVQESGVHASQQPKPVPQKQVQEQSKKKKVPTATLR